MVQCLDLQDVVPIGGHYGHRAGGWDQETFKGGSVEYWRELVLMENPNHNRCHTSICRPPDTPGQVDAGGGQVDGKGGVVENR